jgi:hypothetical protein
MPNPENIIPPKKGEIRNPKGKPKGTLNRSTLLKKWLAVQTKIKRPDNGSEEQVPLSDAIALGIIRQAMKGDVNAYKEIMDTLYGKLTDKIDHTTGGEKLQNNIVVSEKAQAKKISDLLSKFDNEDE